MPFGNINWEVISRDAAYGLSTLDAVKKLPDEVLRYART
jgi:hypothetical protein